MTIRYRSIAALAAGAVSLSGLALGLTSPAHAAGPDLQITEISYGGKADKAPTSAGSGNGEYVEVTNVGDSPQSLAGFTYAVSKSAAAPTAGVIDLSPLGTIAPGESFLITDLTPAQFRSEWGLTSSVKVINDGAQTINSGAITLGIFNGSTRVESLGWAAGYLPAKGVAAFVNAGHLGDATTATSGAWTVPAATTDAEGSWLSAVGATGSVGSPGASRQGTSTPASVRDLPASEDSHAVVKLDAVDPATGAVTVKNTGTSSHDVSGWTVKNKAGTALTIPADTTLAAAASQVFTASPNTFKATDLATLYDGATVVDTRTWAGADPNWANISINEVSSDNGDKAYQAAAGLPFGDAIELYNSGTAAVDLTGWKQVDSGAASAATTFGPIYVNGSATQASDLTIPGHGYAVFSSTKGLGSGGDGVKLYSPDGIQVDSLAYGAGEAGYDESADPNGTIRSLAACPEGSHSYLKVASYSFGSSNAVACTTGIPLGTAVSDVPCSTEAPAPTTKPVAGEAAWPGSVTVGVADAVCAWDGGGTQQDLSGLVFDPTDPSILWAVKNKSVVFKLQKSGGLWTKVTTGGWAAGKTLLFPTGSGQPDSEGMTVGPDGALYVTTERDNAANKVPLDSILRFDPSGSGSTLTATDQWTLTGDLGFAADDSADSNLGFEGVTYVPDSYLVAHGFLDDSTHAAYAPATYPGKEAAGLFFAAVEKTGHLRAYALNTDHSFTRVADVDTGMAGVMDVAYDADLHRIWAQCDNTCGVDLTLLSIGADGHLAPERHFARPAGLPNNNLEGFAVAPVSAAVDGRREVVWSDDGNFGTSTTGVATLAAQGGHSLWSGQMNVDLGLQGLPQAVAFTSAPPAGAKVGGPTYTPTATGGASGTAVKYGAAGACTISAGMVSFTAAGTCTVTATQAGNAAYAAATPVTQSFTVAAADKAPDAPQPPALGMPGNPAPVAGAALPAKIKAKAKKVTVSFAAAGAASTVVNGKVTVYDGKKKVGTFTVKNGKARITFKKKLTKGKHRLKLVLGGSATSKATTIKKTLKVR